MDGTRFDALTRGLSARLSRRRAIASLVGLAGATLAVDSVDAASTRTCRLAAGSCIRNSQCCSGTCDTARTTPRGKRNRCVCPPTADVCLGLCTDVDTDERNCGRCGVRCLAGQSCTNGECICDDSNAIVCDGACTDITTPEHCGPSCEPCPDGYSCENGACTCGGNICKANEGCCGGSCTSTVQNDNNCGACGNACADGEICIDSDCVATCTRPTSSPCVYCANLINGDSVNLTSYDFTNTTNCTSDTDCAAGMECIAFFHTPANSPGADYRPGKCVTLTRCP
jgi:hypothetical protein